MNYEGNECEVSHTEVRHKGLDVHMKEMSLLIISKMV